MAGEQSVVLHAEDLEDLEELSDADAGILLKAIMQYILNGSICERLDGDVRVMFRFIRRHIDRDKAKYAETCRKRAENGRLGGRPKKANGLFDNQMLSNKALATFAFPENQGLAKKADTDTERDPDTDTEYDTEPDPVAAASAAVPPPDGDSENMYEDRTKRIKFLKTMIRLYSNGSLEDREICEEYRSELRALEGG